MIKHTTFGRECPSNGGENPLSLSQSQPMLFSYLEDKAQQARRQYRHPHLHPDLVNDACNNSIWTPQANEDGQYYTHIIAFHDPNQELLNISDAFVFYHINSTKMVTAFYLKAGLTPYSIKEGFARIVIDEIFSKTGARYLGPTHSSPLHWAVKDSILWQAVEASADNFGTMLGINTKRKRNYNNKPGGRARGMATTLQAEHTKSSIQELKDVGMTNAEIAAELEINIRSVQRHLSNISNIKKGDTSIPTFNCTPPLKEVRTVSLKELNILKVGMLVSPPKLSNISKETIPTERVRVVLPEKNNNITAGDMKSTPNPAGGAQSLHPLLNPDGSIRCEIL